MEKVSSSQLTGKVCLVLHLSLETSWVKESFLCVYYRLWSRGTVS